ncbi:hypothetical protein Tco_1225853 [Tanacetum coccineum]
MHCPSWRKIELERKAGVIGNIRSQFDLTQHMQSPFWLKIQKGIEQQLAKIYTDNKSALKHEHWVLKPDRTPDEEGIRSRHPPNITPADWDKRIAFWLDPKNLSRAAQNAQNRARAWSYAGRDPGHLLSSEICRASSRGTFPVLAGFWRDREGTSSLYPSLDARTPPMSISGSESGGGGDDEPGEDEDAKRMRMPTGMRIVRTCYIWEARLLDYNMFILVFGRI